MTLRSCFICLIEKSYFKVDIVINFFKSKLIVKCFLIWILSILISWKTGLLSMLLHGIYFFSPILLKKKSKTSKSVPRPESKISFAIILKTIWCECKVVKINEKICTLI